jgi:hypothetical protein
MFVRSDAEQSNYAILTSAMLLSLNALISPIGGWPKNQPYSRLNWLTLSYSTSYTAVWHPDRPSASADVRFQLTASSFQPNVPSFSWGATVRPPSEASGLLFDSNLAGGEAPGWLRRVFRLETSDRSPSRWKDDVPGATQERRADDHGRYVGYSVSPSE